MTVYPGGLSRGDTPPHEIPTVGAAGKPRITENQLLQLHRPCPFYKDAELPFSARSTGMSLDVVQPSDCPAGPRRFNKDISMSLYTKDIPRAQPVLAHDTTAAGAPMPWKHIEKPPLPEVPQSRAKTHYPPVSKTRLRDLSLNASDIDGALPRGIGLNCEGKRRRDVTVDPLNPAYALPSSEAPAPTPVSARTSGHRALDVSDIEGARIAPSVPVRNQYGDPMRVEDEFRSWRHDRALIENRTLAPPGWSSRNGPYPRKQSEEASSAPVLDLPQRAPLTPRREGPQRSARSTDPLDPQYRVPLAKDKPGTSLNCLWAEEKKNQQELPPEVASHTIGRVEGSTPRTQIRDNGQPFFSLQAHDILGANPKRRVGAMMYNMYDSYGHRPVQSTNLDTKDIKGAQADTLIRHPKVKRPVPVGESTVRPTKTGDGDFDLMFADGVVDR